VGIGPCGRSLETGVARAADFISRVSPFVHGLLAARAQVFVSAFGHVLVIGLGARMLLRSSP
jgi:hypothetical protein